MISKKIQNKLQKLSYEDRQEYYNRFEWSPWTHLNFSFRYYMLFILTCILLIVAGIYKKLDGEGTIQLIQSVTDIIRIIFLILILDVGTYVWNVIEYYYKRNKWFKSKGL